MKKNLPALQENKDMVVSWVYTWSRQKEMSVNEQHVILRFRNAKSKLPFFCELSLQNESKIPLLPFLYGVVAFVYSTATLNG